jgi:murein hydrolase activator
LKKQMATKQKQDQKLSGAIAAAIRRATDAAMKESKKNAANKTAADRVAASNLAKSSGRTEDNTPAEPATLNTVKTAPKSVFGTEADVNLTGSFEKYKGRLSWPVTGTISMQYGPHEYIKGIWHNNAGVTIDVTAGAAVKAVFEGEVQNVMNIGDVQAVMIRHGKYFTTYSNLSTVSVTKGEHVGTGQILGRVGEIAQLEFVLSDDKNRNLDPERWLKR